MKIIQNNKSIIESRNILGNLINSHLELLMPEKGKNKQKILELCHVGKFLMFFNNKIQIDELTEKPDFILKGEFGKIGLEHQILVDHKSKEREGFFENIFSMAEKELNSDKNLPNFLITCYPIPYVNFKINEKEELVKTIVRIVKEYIISEKLIENRIIERIMMTDHSQKSLNVNLGAWWVKDVTEELILSAVRKKESKLASYRKNSGEKQWLLIVIGSNGESSYNLDNPFEMNLKTEFEKVYILEDFNNRLFELK
jgi:hypothetical protein